VRCLALALLLLQAQEVPPWNSTLESLKYLLRHQGTDGSWGGPTPGCTCKSRPDASEKGDLESTAWAILAISAAGYTELSKDDLGGIPVAPRMKSAMTWLLSKQGKDGWFDRSDVSVNTLAALSVFEVYGMTLLHKEEAVKAFDALRNSKPSDDVARIRWSMAWVSAQLGDLVPDAKEPLRETAVALEAGTSSACKIGALLIRASLAFPRGTNRAVKVDYTSFDPLKLPAEECNTLTIAWCHMDGGKEWHEWFDRLRKDLGRQQQKDDRSCNVGSWEATTPREILRTTAIRSLTVEHYRCYYCRSAFRERK
jgi:hypothetical protein